MGSRLVRRRPTLGEVTRRISRLGPPHGEYADALATQLEKWLTDFNPLQTSSAYYDQYEDGTDTADTDRDLIRRPSPRAWSRTAACSSP